MRKWHSVSKASQVKMDLNLDVVLAGRSVLEATKAVVTSVATKPSAVNDCLLRISAIFTKGKCSGCVKRWW